MPSRLLRIGSLKTIVIVGTAALFGVLSAGPSVAETVNASLIGPRSVPDAAQPLVKPAACDFDGTARRCGAAYDACTGQGKSATTCRYEMKSCYINAGCPSPRF